MTNASTQPTKKPGAWLVAAWPGMSGVAVMSAGYLVQHLGLQQVAELPSRDHFDVNEVAVKDGLLLPIQLPRGIFFRGSAPGIGRDLIVFLGEAQPTDGLHAYAQELIAMAQSMGVERVVTFASMASGLHPSQNPKVTGVATDHAMLEELRLAEVEPLREGQIGGLNGVVLAVAAERGIPGFGLLAEIPFFAAAVPNPKAVRAALSVFSVLTRIDISLTELDEQAVAVDQALIAALERMKAEQEKRGESEEEESEEGEESPEEGEAPQEAPPETPTEAAAPSAAPPDEPKLDFESRRRIERLFDEARKNPAKAMDLKRELDRLGIFAKYEDRFLDLFRRAE
ncbi:MAG: PAC2 family protein [Phycisphaerales bacterium]